MCNWGRFRYKLLLSFEANFCLFIGRESTTWRSNNCLQIMACSCVKETTLFSFLWSLLCENADRFASRGYSLKKQTLWSNDKTIIELGYRKISWFMSSIHRKTASKSWNSSIKDGVEGMEHEFSFRTFCKRYKQPSIQGKQLPNARYLVLFCCTLIIMATFFNGTSPLIKWMGVLSNIVPINRTLSIL